MFGDPPNSIVNKFIKKFSTPLVSKKIYFGVFLILNNQIYAEESVGAMEKVQEEIKFRLSENTTYFTTHCTALTSNSAPITSSLGDLATVLELENERMDKTLDRAHGFAGELQRVAGDIIKLSNERRDLTQSITKKRRFQMISTHN